MSKPSYKELEKELIAIKTNAIDSSKELPYKKFFDNMADMVDVIELIYDKNGQPVDFYIRVINISFAKFFGKTQEQLLNKKISSIVDHIEDNWFTSFAIVDSTGEEVRFKSYGAAYDKFYQVTAWKFSENRVGVSMSDITITEKAEIKLKNRLEKEKEARVKTERLLKEKRVELQKTIYNLNIANEELAFQNKEKQKRADELAIANAELAFQNKEKDNRADELAIANTELAFQNNEKDSRADELILANKEKRKRADELVLANKEKEKRANELILANKELAFQTELDVYRSEMERVAHDLTLLIDTANAPIFGIDSKGLVNEWNQTSESITGFTKDEVLGKDLVQTYITEDYRESVKKVLDDALLGKETANYEFPLFAKDGQRVMVLLNSSTRRDAKGKITGVLGVGQDISEIDKLRTVSESIAKELRQFIETANAPIFGIDSKGLVNEWNQTSESITGFTKDEVLEKDLVQTYITEDYRESVKKVLDDALLGKETANYEFPLFTKDGQRVMVLLNSSTRRDINGEIIGVLGVGQDITELAGYRNELELKVNERTLKLNQALEKQKELNELKSRFVSTASHEFRTPLSSINFAAGSIKKYWAKMEPIIIQKKTKQNRRSGFAYDKTIRRYFNCW